MCGLFSSFFSCGTTCEGVPRVHVSAVKMDQRFPNSQQNINISRDNPEVIFLKKLGKYRCDSLCVMCNGNVRKDKLLSQRELRTVTKESDAFLPRQFYFIRMSVTLEAHISALFCDLKNCPAAKFVVQLSQRRARTPDGRYTIMNDRERTPTLCAGLCPLVSRVTDGEKVNIKPARTGENHHSLLGKTREMGFNFRKFISAGAT